MLFGYILLEDFGPIEKMIWKDKNQTQKDLENPDVQRVQ
jgi:hypothetical protein